jgi:hypothetical protein
MPAKSTTSTVRSKSQEAESVISAACHMIPLPVFRRVAGEPPPACGADALNQSPPKTDTPDWLTLSLRYRTLILLAREPVSARRARRAPSR